MTLLARLQAYIDECADGEEDKTPPGWCVRTGKCTCARALVLIEQLTGCSTEIQELAEAAFDLGADINEPSE